MIKFCILAEPRSGTTFFNSCLNRHQDVHSFGEIMPGYQSETDFHHYWLQQVQQDPATLLLEGVNKVFQAYLRNVLSNRPEKALGLDIKYYQLEWKRSFLDVLEAEKFKIIHIIRRNFLKRYMSVLLHNSTIRDALGRPMHTSREVSPTLVIVPDAQKLPALFEGLERTINEYQAVFDSAFPCLTIGYEEMIDTDTNFLTPIVADTVFDFLGVAAMAETPTSPLRKMNPDKMRYAIMNYYEVVEVLQETRYRDLLDEPQWDVECKDLHKELFLGHQEFDRDVPKAMKHYMNAMTVDPSDSVPYYYMALVYGLTSRPDKMNDMLEKAVSLCTDPQMRVQYEKMSRILNQQES